MFSYVAEKQDAWGHVLTADTYILQYQLTVEGMNRTHRTGTWLFMPADFKWSLKVKWFSFERICLTFHLRFIDCDLSVNFLQ